GGGVGRGGGGGGASSRAGGGWGSPPGGGGGVARGFLGTGPRGANAATLAEVVSNASKTEFTCRPSSSVDPSALAASCRPCACAAALPPTVERVEHFRGSPRSPTSACSRGCSPSSSSPWC